MQRIQVAEWAEYIAYLPVNDKPMGDACSIQVFRRDKRFDGIARLDPALCFFQPVGKPVSREVSYVIDGSPG